MDISGMPPRRLGMACIGLLLLATACASPTPTPSSLASPSASATNVASGLPEGCQFIDLRGPDQRTVLLTGLWSGTGYFIGPRYAENVWIVQVGDCVWGVVVEQVVQGGITSEGGTGVGSLRGHIGTDFGIDLELVVIARPAYLTIPPPTTSAVRLLIEFAADGQVHLREELPSGQSGVRCPDPNNPCTNSVDLYRVGDGPGG